MTRALQDELARRIRERRVLVLAGTGVSLATTGNSPVASWKGLLSSGIDQCLGLSLISPAEANQYRDLLNGSTDALLAAAQIVTDKLRRSEGNWSMWLRETVGALRPTHPELISAIAELGCPLATLNYDNLLSDVT